MEKESTVELNKNKTQFSSMKKTLEFICVATFLCRTPYAKTHLCCLYSSKPVANVMGHVIPLIPKRFIIVFCWLVCWILLEQHTVANTSILFGVPWRFFEDCKNQYEPERSTLGTLLYEMLLVRSHKTSQFDGILPKGPYPPCLRIADRAHLAWYPRIENL